MAKPRTRTPKSENPPSEIVENSEEAGATPKDEATGELPQSGADEANGAPEGLPEDAVPPAQESAAPVEAAEAELVEADAPVAKDPSFEAQEPDDSSSEASDDAPAPSVPAPETETAPQPVVVKRGGFMPLLLGGVIAAVVGAGAAIYTLPKLPPQFAAWFPAAPDASAEMDAKLGAQSDKIDALTSELAALKAAQPPAPDLSGVQSALDQIGSEVRANKAALEDLQKQVTGLAASGSSADASAQAQIEASVKAAQDRIDQAEQQAKQLQEQSQAAAKAAMAQAASARMKAALDAGAPLDPARADLRAAGIAVPEALSGDVPSLQSLQADFPEAARAALAAARKAESGASLGDRLGAFLLTQTGARSLTPKAGDGPDAVLSRAQADVSTGDLKAALEEIAKLPEAAQPALADWSAKAQARVAALDAAGQLGQSQ